jgi:hypothetical protein
MYSPGMPMTFGIAVINFTIIYMIDKYLLLRFYKIPKNYNEQCIKFAISEFKYCFIFHFIIGMLVYSNEKILSSTGKVLSGFDDEQKGSVTSLNRYNSVHVLLFLSGGVILIILMIFESTVVSFFAENIKCFINI